MTNSTSRAEKSGDHFSSTNATCLFLNLSLFSPVVLANTAQSGAAARSLASITPSSSCFDLSLSNDVTKMASNCRVCTSSLQTFLSNLDFIGSLLFQKVINEEKIATARFRVDTPFPPFVKSSQNRATCFYCLLHVAHITRGRQLARLAAVFFR